MRTTGAALSRVEYGRGDGESVDFDLVPLLDGIRLELCERRAQGRPDRLECPPHRALSLDPNRETLQGLEESEIIWRTAQDQPQRLSGRTSGGALGRAMRLIEVRQQAFNNPPVVEKPPVK